MVIDNNRLVFRFVINNHTERFVGDKADVGSPLLEAVPVQVFDHSGDTCFTVVVVTDIPCCPSLDHLYFVFVRLCVGVPCGSGIF